MNDLRSQRGVVRMTVEQMSTYRVLRRTAMFAGVAAFVLGWMGGAAQAEDAVPKSPNDPTGAFFTRHCQACHAGDKPKGKFALDSLSRDFGQQEGRAKWLAVLEQISVGNMPPAGKP